MGRKNRNRISKSNDVIEEEDHIDETEDLNIIQEEKEEERRFDIIYKTRLAMIKYVDEMALPLCDYLDQQVIEDFIDYLSEQ